MRYLNILLFLMMLPFLYVQFNDPDGPMWILIYAVPTVWSGLAAFRLNNVLSSDYIASLSISVAIILVLTGYYWPTTPNFWQEDVWWVTETAREGLGMMIASFVLLVAAFTIYSASKNKLQTDTK
jgi:hypothetical protein